MAGDKIKILWREPARGAVANALGYYQHASMMRKYCEEYFEYDESAPIAMTICPADQFEPIPGKKNILFTMWECIDVPASYAYNLKRADLIITPSTFCKEIFKQYTDKPIMVCFEGVEPEVFTFKERSMPEFHKGEKFRFLWLGAPNPRKGYFSVIELVKLAEKMPNMEIYIKTTAPKKLKTKDFVIVFFKYLHRMFWNISPHSYRLNFLGEWNNLKGSVRRFIHPEVADKFVVSGQHKNIIMDTRKLSQDELVALYHSAHCFLSPHSGEGWGLTLCEAMATGCPSIASYATGVTDFLDREVGYPVVCEIKSTKLQNYKLTARMYVPDTRDFIQQVFNVFGDYKEALRRGRKASYKIRTLFTWKKSAKRLKNIVEEFIDGDDVKVPALRDDAQLCGVR